MIKSRFGKTRRESVALLKRLVVKARPVADDYQQLLEQFKKDGLAMELATLKDDWSSPGDRYIRW